VLQIRIRRRSRDGKKSRSRIQGNIQDLIFENLVLVFWDKNTSKRIRDLVNHGSGMEKVGSGTNFPDGSGTLVKSSPLLSPSFQNIRTYLGRIFQSQLGVNKFLGEAEQIHRQVTQLRLITHFRTICCI
jgi:hypothetical protein